MRLILPALLIMAMFSAPIFALSAPYPAFTNWTDAANGITYTDAGYTHAIVRDADGAYWFALRRLYNNPTSVYELFTSANNGSSWSSVGTYDTGLDGGCLADLRMYTLDNEIYIDTWCGGNFIYHVNKTNAQVIASHGIGFQGACGTNSTNIWCISSVGINYEVTIFDKGLNVVNSFSSPKPTANDGGIGGIQFNQKEDLAEFIFWDGFSSAYYSNITSNPVIYATNNFVDNSFETIQTDASNNHLNAEGTRIATYWYTDNVDGAANTDADDVDWTNLTDGYNFSVSSNDFYAGTNSLAVDITDATAYQSVFPLIVDHSGLNMTAADNYQATFYIKGKDLSEANPCTSSSNDAVIYFTDAVGSGAFNLGVCNSTYYVYKGGALSVFKVDTVTEQNVTGADGGTWRKFVVNFNLTTNISNFTIAFGTDAPSGTASYFADAVSISPVTTRGYSTNTNTFAAEHGWDDNFLAFKNGRKFLVAGTAYKQSADGTIWSGNFFPNPTNPYSKAAMLEDVGHNDTFIIYSNGAAVYYMESEDYGNSFSSPVAIIDSPSQDYRVQVRGSSFPSYNTFGSHTGFLDMIVGAATNNDAFFVPLLHEDTLAPEIAISSPSGSVTSPFAITYTISSETGSPVDSCWISIDNGANQTLPLCSNATSTQAVGSHFLTIYANDTANNIGSSERAFNVVLPPPVTANVTGTTASVYIVIPALAGLIIVLFAISEMMKGSMDVKEASVMIIVGILLIIVTASIVASNV